MFDSLRLRLQLLLILPMVGVAALDIWGSIRSAEETARLVQERMLIGAARMIGGQVVVNDQVVEVDVPPAALELFVAPPYRDSVFYRISTPDARTVAGNYDLPGPEKAVGPDQAVYYATHLRNTDVYAVAFGQPVFERTRGPVTIVVGQTLAGRQAFARSLWRHDLVDHAAMLALVVLLLHAGLAAGMRPLSRLQRSLASRVPGALDRIEAQGTAAELRPLVEVVNDYVERLDRYLSAQQRFISNAAHQLRTPLALLSTQAAFGRRSDSAQAKVEALEAMDAGVQHAIRLVNQLIAHDMTHVRLGQGRSAQPMDLSMVARRVLESQGLAAAQKNIDLGFDGPLEGAVIRADELLLREAIANLVDNAIRYTPEAGRVTVSIEAAQACIRLHVIDNGPGIPDSEKQRAFERFYRLNNSRSDGSGLGLAIVREIVEGYAGTIALNDAHPPTGLDVEVTFPRECT